MSDTANRSKVGWRILPKNIPSSPSSSEIDSSDSETLSTSEIISCDSETDELEFVSSAFATKLTFRGDNISEEHSYVAIEDLPSFISNKISDEHSYVIKEDFQPFICDDEISEEYSSVRSMLNEIVENIQEKKNLPDIIAELIVRKKMNYIVLDLQNYDEGYAVSFCCFDKEERFHGYFSYSVGVIDYIRCGEIPYELLDKFLDYEFQLFYDGFVACKLRFHFGFEEGVRDHFVLLNQTIQSIDGECAMRLWCDNSLDLKKLRASLIYSYAPDLCLDPDPVLADIMIMNELNETPFITPHLTHFIQNEKLSVEKVLKDMPEDLEYIYRNEENYCPELHVLPLKVADVAHFVSEKLFTPSVISFLKTRKICFPDKKFITGDHHSKGHIKKGDSLMLG